VFAGVDYEDILRAAEKEADVVIWDGGNNDLPFYTPDLMVVVADPLRPGHELKYHPGEANLADVVVINKVDSATPEALAGFPGRRSRTPTRRPRSWRPAPRSPSTAAMSPARRSWWSRTARR
jgi:hypothetical protein